MADVNSLAEEIQKSLNSFLTKTVGVEEHGDIPLVPTGINVLDLILGGGIGIGTFTVAVGYSGSFKSTVSIEIAKAFKRYDERTPILYIDTEASMTVARMASIGLKNVTPLTDFTVEKVFATIDALQVWKEEQIKNDPSFKDVPILIIWDSIANTPTEAELKEVDPNKTIGLKSRILSSNLPKVINLMQKYKITLYAINQFRDKVTIGPFQAPSELKHMQHDKTMPGGNAIRFNASQLLEFRTVEHKTAEESKYGFRHAIIEVKTVKNKFFPDGYKARLVIDVANGIDWLYTHFDLLVQHKKITTGAWNYLKSLPEKKFRTKDLKVIYNTDKEFAEVFDKELNKVLQELKKKMANMEDIQSNTDNNDIEDRKEEISETGKE